MAEYSVLIVDDDVWMQRILSKTLQSYGFKKTYLASDGFDGIAKAVEFRPNLIILDILMPELSGHLTLKVLKSIKMVRDIPVIMVSALSDVENLGRAVKSGTAGFISKPFTRATVFEKLLDLYGREKLDLIQKGLDIDDKSNLDYIVDFSNNRGDRSQDGNIPGYESAFNLPDFSKEKKDASSSNSEKLNKSYHDDSEQRSIESIKELLMKSRK